MSTVSRFAYPVALALALSLGTLASAAEVRAVSALSVIARLLAGSPQVTHRPTKGTLRVNGAEFAFATQTSALSTEQALADFERSAGSGARCIRQRDRQLQLSVCLRPPAKLELRDAEFMLRERDLSRLGPLMAAVALPGRQGTTLLKLGAEHLPLHELLHPNEALSTNAFLAAPFNIVGKRPVLLVSTLVDKTETPLLAITREPAVEGPLSRPLLFRDRTGASSEWLHLRARHSSLYFAARLPN